MAFQSQLNFQVKKRNNGTLKKNEEFKKLSVKRSLFDATSVSPSKKSRQDENWNENAKCRKSDKKMSTSSFSAAKQVFHTSQPSRLIGRLQEISEIENFIRERVSKHQAGSMYISGAPGTGKTSCLMSVIEKWQDKMSYALINCMSVSNPSDIYKSIARKFKLPSKVTNSKSIVKALEKYFVTSATMNILILDEIDHLGSKEQEVLYTLFEWPQLPKSSLIMIGIANALDLTDRILPRLHVFKFEPVLMHFQPYSKDQIVQILEDRLSSLHSNLPLIKPVALQLCARKIAACTGDIRKALNICHRAVEVATNKKKSELILQSTSDDRCNPGSPSKRSIQLSVDISDISAVLHDVFGSRLQMSDTSKVVTLPLQQMILLCTLILMKRNCKSEDMKLGKVYDIYKRICKKKDIIAVTECEFSGLCKLLDTRGVISLKPSKVIRMSKLILNIDETEAEYLLQDKALLPSILSDKSVLNREIV